uniref:sulfotransferase domain-containing protein n=1 Tax=Ruegeria atlantica TaxID=81569 RepID=UPI00249569F8
RDQKAIAAFLTGLKRRRCIKSHTPMDGISYGAEPTYIVVYRHPVDAHFSFRSHVDNMKDQEMFADQFPADIEAGFNRFLNEAATDKGTDDLTIASITHHYLQSKKRHSNGNVHFFHYADLSRDLRGQITRLADILKIELPAQMLDDISEANTFSSMRRTAEISERRFHGNSPFKDQAKFFESGSSNKWEGKLANESLGKYESRCASLLAPEDAAWLNWGSTRSP